MKKNPVAVAFGKRLRELRDGAGLTLRELSDRAGLNLFAVSRLERGEREPKWGTVLSLAEVLRVKPNAFLPRD